MPAEPLNERDAARRKVPMYHGFRPDVGWVIRSPQRAYAGETYHTKFTAGQAIFPAIAVSDEERSWARGERLSQFVAARYMVYRQGTEPHPDEEPMWFDQEFQPEDLGDDFSAAGFGIERPAVRESATV